MPSSDARPVKAGDHLYLVDGSSYIFRAYHALPPLTRKSDGLPVGAVAGFCNMLWKLLRDLDGEAPTHLAVIFDYSAITFRNRIYDQYKAHRPEPPEDLRPQFKLIREAVHAFNVPCIEQEGFEADDLIATYTRQAVDARAEVTIVASDKDLMQLIEPGVEMYDSMKDRRIAGPEVFEKFGVDPVHVADVQALAGDSIDNVPGVPGIGVKTAASLIIEFGDLETLLSRAGEIKQPKRRQSLIDYADQARVSRQLVELKRDVPLDVPLDRLSVRQPDPERLIAFLKGMEFTTLTKRVAEATGTDTGKVEATPIAVDGWDAEPVHGPDMPAPETAPSAPAPARPVEPGSPGTPAALAAARAQARTPLDRSVYEMVTSLEALDLWIADALEGGKLALSVVASSPDAVSADIVGIALATDLGRAAYVPLGHRAADGLDLGGGGAPAQIEAREALDRLKPVLEDPGVMKIGHDFKRDWVVLERHGIEILPLDDTLLVSYVLDSGAGGHGVEELARRHLDHEPLPLSEITGSGRGKVAIDLVAPERATEYAAERAEIALRLELLLKPRLPAEHVATVYERLERPLMPVLARMERRGILVDRQMLARLSGDFAQKMAALESQIHELAGESFNIGSPKQLGDILFGKMGLKGGKKTKTGAYTTGADTLEELAAEGHPLPGKVLDWRQVSKLKSTYTDALPGYVNAETGRVHTSFALASTTTGRLSSSEPNLQNIPVRTEEGRQIRRAFIAPPGTRLVSADYSQIELRVLAHIADIPQLRDAFSKGLDIHAMTASEMFGTPVEGMDPMVRRRAKAINFGIIYGISAFGLANQLAIPRDEAAAYIKRYFERFPGIRDYMDETRAFARENGYVTTIFGRKCHYPNIAKGHHSERAFYERAAINAPIQGSAADIIRRAMIRMDTALERARIEARMLLQVHDELVFEIPEDAVDDAIPLITRVMEDAPMPAVSLKVPLKVDARAASNWEEAH